MVKLYGFCLSIGYIEHQCHPYIESLLTLSYKIRREAIERKKHQYVCIYIYSALSVGTTALLDCNKARKTIRESLVHPSEYYQDALTTKSLGSLDSWNSFEDSRQCCLCSLSSTPPPRGSLVPRPHPDFISQPWRKIGRRPGSKTTS